MRRAIALIATTLLVGILAATPADAALPVKGKKYSGDLTATSLTGTVTLKVKGKSNRKFGKVVARIHCNDGTDIKAVYRSVKIKDDGSYVKRKSSLDFVFGDVYTKHQINGSVYTSKCANGTHANFVAKP